MYMDGKNLHNEKENIGYSGFASTLEWLGRVSDYCKTGGGTVSF